MRSLLLPLWLVFLALPLGGGELKLPSFYRHAYEASRRDPMVDATTSPTLTGGPAASATQIAAGNALQTLLAEVSRVLRSRLLVGGVAAGPGGQGRAIVSGVEVATGDRFVVPIQKELNARLQGVLRTYDGKAERVPLDAEHEALVLVVGAVQPGGVALNLPGFQTPICFLAYDRKLRLEPRRIDAPAKP